MADAHKNFAYSTVLTAPSPATSGTSVVVQSGDGAKFPAVPFNATIWPVSSQPTSANAEIVRVTAISTDTLTITRATESSSARTVVVGDQIAATITAKTLTDVENVTYETRSSNTILAAADRGKYIDISAAITQTFTAAATLGAGWSVTLRNTGTGTTVVALDPNSSETIDGATTMHMLPGEVRLVICNGTLFNTIMLDEGTGLYAQVTSLVTITGTAEATPTDVVTLGALTYDAADYWVELFGPDVSSNAVGTVLFNLWDGATDLCRLSEARAASSSDEKHFFGKVKVTLTAGSHTLKAAAIKTTGNTVTLSAGTGAGGGGTYAPIFIKSWKA